MKEWTANSLLRGKMRARVNSFPIQQLAILGKMSNIESKLKTTRFWLWLGVTNHAIALAVLALGCAYSGFTCHGQQMKTVLSVYTFTLFTPQIALEVILLMALFLVSDSLRDFRDNFRPLALFVLSLTLLSLFAIWR